MTRDQAIEARTSLEYALKRARTNHVEDGLAVRSQATLAAMRVNFAEACEELESARAQLAQLRSEQSKIQAMSNVIAIHSSYNVEGGKRYIVSRVFDGVGVDADYKMIETTTGEISPVENFVALN